MNVNSISKWLWPNCVYFFVMGSKCLCCNYEKRALYSLLCSVLQQNCVCDLFFQEFLHVTHLSQMSKVELWAPNDKERIKLQKRVLCVLCFGKYFGTLQKLEEYVQISAKWNDEFDISFFHYVRWKHQYVLLLNGLIYCWNKEQNMCVCKL